MKRLIFGCGYLGLPTAKRWLAAGDEVAAVTRDTKKFDAWRALGMQPILGDITQPNSFSKFPDADTVLFAVGMDRSRYSDIRSVYVDGLRSVLERLSQSHQHFIYISSTGVLGHAEGDWLNESSPTNPLRDGGQACLEAEALIHSSSLSERATILRFAGIYGPQRIPFQAAIEQQEWQRLSPDGFLNLIHVEDGARIIQRVAERKLFGETFLVSDGNPVERKKFYETLASLLESGPIVWPSETSATESTPSGPIDNRRSRGRSDKRISNQKLQRQLDEPFLFPDYIEGLRDAI